MTLTEKQKRQKKVRKARLMRQEKPHWNECLICDLSCEVNIRYGATSFNQVTCPKKHKGEPAFPYAYEEMKRQEEKRRQLFEQSERQDTKTEELA